MDFSAVDKEVTEGVENGVFPGAVVLVSQAGKVLYRRATGWRSLEPTRTPVHEETIYDIASLTKPLATTVAMMLLVKEKKLRLDDRVTRFFPNFGVQGKQFVTFRQLLSHSSGLPAWRPYYKDIIQQEAKAGRVSLLGTRSAREYVYTQLLRERLEAPPGQKAVYSDLGFMLLGAVVEEISGLEFDQYCSEKIFSPLEMRDSLFINLEKKRRLGVKLPEERFAPTERCPWRKRVLCAEVHDDNAYAMGGIAGHAGMFSTVDDIHRLVSCLTACYRGEHWFLPAAVVQEFWTCDARVAHSTWALGWDTPSAQHSSAGELFSSRSVGHLGFTGVSVWIDLERQVHVILLSNRVHPRRENDAIKTFRPALHNIVMQAVLGTI
ncbi:MAG TPA: serine hydrolase domain-containing protein [Methylomirabilota bacterium]|nr:serine hydrolase domain-containing protein [Methylomirabilota bacterium]